MTEHVVFLAEGGTRKRAAIAEANRVLAGGATVTLVLRHLSQWSSEPIPERAQVIDLHDLEKREGWVPLEWLLLVRGPRFLFRIVGVGPLKGLAGRASRSWRRRVANPVHQRVSLPLIRLRARSRPIALLERGLGARTTVDLLVVTDPVSMPTAVEFLERRNVPRVAYNLDHAAAAAAMGDR